MRDLALISSVAVLLPLLAHAQAPSISSPPCDTRFFDRDRLERLIAEKKVASIADILRQTPACFLDNRVAIYRSSSLHCATPKAPRIILYLNNDENGNSLCSFNSGRREDYAEFYSRNPGIDCHEDTLECQSFNRATNRFEYYELTVPKNDEGTPYRTARTRAQAHVSRANPTECMRCHRGTEPFLGEPNPRPNLENYPTWPGFYGSQHDKLNVTPSERRNYFEVYLPYRALNARYSAVPELFEASGRPKGENSKPIVNLHNLLEMQNYRRIASEFTDDRLRSRLWPYRYAILGALTCSDNRMAMDMASQKLVPGKDEFTIESFLPAPTRAAFPVSFAEQAARVLRLHQTNLRAQVEIQALAGESRFEQFDTIVAMNLANDPEKPYTTWLLAHEHDFWDMTRLAYLGENLGLPVEDWSLSFRRSVDFGAGRHNPRRMLPLLAEKFLDPVQDSDLKLNLDTALGIPVDATQCERLRAKSLEALSGVVPDPRDSSFCRALLREQQPSAPVPAGLPEIASRIPDDRAPQTLAICMSCHVNGTAPSIPYNDPTRLKGALAAPSLSHPERPLIDEIVRRIDAGIMPPTTTLTTEQRTELKDYFRRVRMTLQPVATGR